PEPPLPFQGYWTGTHTTHTRSLNPTLNFRAHPAHITPQTAGAIISQYDLVLDCTDHPTSRYLLSDACVLYRKPLVFASALQTSGQLMLLNHPPKPTGDLTGGPCYRCVFPRPSPPGTVVSCGEGGILGPVVGVMGVLQALEGIKVLASGELENEGLGRKELGPSHMLLFSGHVAAPFRSVKMAGRRKGCFACGEGSSLSKDSLAAGSVDYVAFCGVTTKVEVLTPAERVSVAEYREVATRGGAEHLLLDVREAPQFGIASLDGAVNVPFSVLMRGVSAEGAAPEWMPTGLSPGAPIYVVCRQGEDSQLAARKIKEAGLDGGGARFVGDIEGGMRAWKLDIDPTLPFT
ncbi:ThiF family adenylyltransferase, partial [Candidatus Bathyarchaeota archaeon]|nr:ThiF family adenylyltransferase [Candidatus Bathyarchaeota archaeon]